MSEFVLYIGFQGPAAGTLFHLILNTLVLWLGETRKYDLSVNFKRIKINITALT